jgi:hypothetical protein
MPTPSTLPTAALAGQLEGATLAFTYLSGFQAAV